MTDSTKAATRARMECIAVDASPEGVASFLHSLANRIEAGQGDEVLIGMWNTGHGEDWEFTFQVVIDGPQQSGSTEATP